MPDRFWVGGTASWDGTAGTKWAATSGGPGGASVPTSADDVFFDSLSTGICTIATGNTGARSINCTGFAGTLTGTAAITVAGSVTLVAAMAYTHTGTMTFTGTGTLTTAGKTFSGVTINGAGITLTLGDDLNISTRTITVTAGTFTTNGRLIIAGALSSSNTNARTINLGASTLTLSSSVTPVAFGIPVNLTFNAGTSQINITSLVNPTFDGGGRTFNNVAFTAGAAACAMSGTNTFNNLSLNGTVAGGLLFLNNQIINGTLSTTNASTFQGFLASEVVGTPRTLTVAALSADGCNFRDIIIAGAAAGTAPVRAGDCGGNSGIVFPAAKTVYRVGTDTNWTGNNSWALTSGGPGANVNLPLPQDTAIIDNNTALTGTLLFNAVTQIGAVNCSTRTTGLTLSYGANISYYGSHTLSSAITVTGALIQTFSGRGTMDFTSAGKTITFSITVDTPSGTFRLLDAATLSNTFTLTRGTLDLNTTTLSTRIFSCSNSNTRTLAFGTGNIAVTGTGVVWDGGTVTGLTVTGTKVVNITNNTATAVTLRPGSLFEANAISFNFTAGTYTLTLDGGSYQNLNFNGFLGTLAVNGRSIFGDLTLSAGMTLAGGTGITTFASTSATPRTIRTNGKTLDFPLTFNGVGGTFRLLDALAMGSTRGLTHTNGTIDLNGFNLTVGASYTTAGGTKNLTFNGGTLTCPAPGNALNNASPTGFSTTAGTSTGTINMTAATSKNFLGGGSTFNCTLNNGGAGALTITGSNTFTTLQNTVQPTSFLFTAGTTTTLTNWAINGTPGNLVTIGSVTAASHTLSKASGTVSADYLSISRSTATGGATWNAANSVDGGNNSGWIFGAISGIVAALAASEVGPDTFAASAFIGAAVSAALAASEVGPDILAADAFIGYKVLAALAASEIGPDIFAALVTIGAAPPPILGDIYPIELRSFTERRRF